MPLPALALPRIDAWVFDMDATLTVGKHDFEAIRRDLGLPKDKAILESIAALPPAAQVPLRKALAEWEWDIARQTEAAPGAAVLLTRLKERGCPLAILTRNRRDIALHTLQAAGLIEFFEASLILGRDCAPPKPAPDGILKIRERWGRPLPSVAMVGDYLFDLQAGRAADCFTIEVGIEPQVDWAEFRDFFVSDLHQLFAAING